MSAAVVIGAGPGIGRAVARVFAAQGMPVAVVARRHDTVRATAAAVAELGGRALELTADAADEAGLRAALDAAVAEFGTPEALVYNAAVIRHDLPGELTHREHQEAWAVNVLGAMTAAGHLAPAMARRGRGSILLTGGMPEPRSAVTSLSLGKAGVRALTRLLDEEYGPSGVHVATVTVAGAVAPDTAFDPADIAEHYWRLHRQPAGQWEREVLFDGTGG